MKLLHTADWHLGKQLYGNSLIADQSYVLEQFREVVIDQKPDAIVVAGDVFDRAIPSIDALKLFEDTLHWLTTEYQKPVCIIAGNHDNPARLSYGSKFLEKDSVFLVGSVTEQLEPIGVQSRAGAFALCPLPYFPVSAGSENDIDKRVSAKLDAFSSVQTIPKILIAHTEIRGALRSGSERSIGFTEGEGVSAKVFEGFAYTALGHLHRAQSFQGNTVRYSGSILKYSAAEVHDQKSFSLISFDSSAALEIEEILINPKRDLRKTRGYFQNLLDREVSEEDRNDYLIVELLDQDPVIDAMTRLRERYPHLIHLRRITSEQSTPDSSDQKKAVEISRDERELFAAFAETVTGQKPDNKEANFFAAVLNELHLRDRNR